VIDAPRMSDSIGVCGHSESGSGLFEGKEPRVCPAARKTERIVNSFHTPYGRRMDMGNMIKEG
jgi:hypothetical protein